MSANPDLAQDAHPVRDDRVVTDLVSRARNGDKKAWDALVERYAPLIWSICRRHQLGDADAADVGRSIWLQLADHMDTISDSAALASWLAATARQECGRIVRPAPGSCAAGSVPGAERRGGPHESMPPPPWKDSRTQNRVFWTRHPTQSGQVARARIRRSSCADCN